MPEVEPGTVVSRTTKPEVILPALFSELLSIDPENEHIEDLREFVKYYYDPEWDPEEYNLYEAGMTFDEAEAHFQELLFDELSALAPEGMYFGAHWGDAVDYGFWPIEDAVEEGGEREDIELFGQVVAGTRYYFSVDNTTHQVVKLTPLSSIEIIPWNSWKRYLEARPDSVHRISTMDYRVEFEQTIAELRSFQLEENNMDSNDYGDEELGYEEQAEAEGFEPMDTDESSTERPVIMDYFQYRHLPTGLQRVSEPFCNLAEATLENLPNVEERQVALRKLLEAKDAAVRAATEA